MAATRVSDGSIRWVLGSLLLGSAIFLYMGLPTIAETREIDAKIRKVEGDIISLQHEIVIMKMQEEALRSDPLYLERVIKSKLRMVRRGEAVSPVQPSDSKLQ